MMTKLMRIILTFLVIFPVIAWGQRATLHGYVNEMNSGEALIGATVFVKGSTTGTATNVYGFYSLSLPPGKYSIIYSFIGYDNLEKVLELKEDMQLTVELGENTREIAEVVVKSEAKNNNITRAQMGLEKISAKTIERIPVLMGEADVIKSIQLMPGVISTSETSSNLSIRGGNRDQNQILLDEANVYNVSHMLGLFSVFNNDAIRNVELYKGVAPAQFGGSLSSVMDIRMKEGNTKKMSGSGSLGLLSSKLTLELPLVKEKGSILLSGRRTYVDLLTKMMHKMNDSAPEIPYYFYDLNAKANYSINDKHRLFVSGYFGRDVFSMGLAEKAKQEMNWGNYTTTVRWNYLINKRLFANATLIASNYDYLLNSESTFGKDKKKNNMKWESALKDYSAKVDFGFFLNPENTIRFGAKTTRHNFTIGKVNAQVDTLKFSFNMPNMYCWEHMWFISNEQRLTPQLTLEYGLNLSGMQNVGKANELKLRDYTVVDTIIRSKGEIFNSYFNIDPRFAFSWTIDDNTSIKAGYAKTHQYMHIASNSTQGNPLDIWMPVTNNIKPQTAHQVSAGVFRNFLGNMLQTSVEGYYKKMNNQIEFREFSEPYLNQKIEEEFRFGEARAYGVEFMLKKPDGDLSGWVSYTLAKSERKTKDIQEKDWYPSPYDQRHSLSVVGMYNILPRLSINANWVFNTGKPFDAPVNRFVYGNVILPYYNGKNQSRYPNYHRLDLGIEWKNKPGKRFETSWMLSAYNVYNRKNANTIYFEQKDNQNTQAYRFAMMQRMYAVSFNFKF